MRGRKPKPRKLKELEGNPGNRPLEPEIPAAPGAPACPDHIQGEARLEWARIIQELEAAGLITKLDRAALAAYCTAWGRWVEAETKLRELGPVVKSPSGYPIVNPFLAIANKAMEQMMKALVEFGMTPSARSRVHPADAQEADPFADFMGAPATPAKGGPLVANPDETPAPDTATKKPARKSKA